MDEITLKEVNNAIRSVMINQSYEIAGRRFTRADLGELRALRKDIKEEIADGGAENISRKGAYRVSFQ